jgi:hypothetical protein
LNIGLGLFETAYHPILGDDEMNRTEIERTIVEELVNRLMAAGWNPAYHNANDEGVIEGISTLAETMDAVFSVDECHVWFKKEGQPHLRQQHVYFVLGNSGYDVICYHTCPGEGRPEHEFTVIVESVLKFAEALRKKHGKV